MPSKTTLIHTSWSKHSYYALAKCGSQDTNHPAWKELLKLINRVKTVLDLGCGEGTRLRLLASQFPCLACTGVDISPTAVKIARKNAPRCHFLVGDIEKLNLVKQFDLVMNFFVLEHLDHPEAFIQRALAHLNPGGFLLLTSPNFGAPNRRSPNSTSSKYLKLLTGFINDMRLSVTPVHDSLNWTKVTPAINSHLHAIDSDTTTEPYIFSLLAFLKPHGHILHASSVWEREEAKSQGARLIAWLGRHNIFPFKYWGPHLLLVLQKNII